MTLYCCGLRVSELINIKVEDVYNELELIKITGKGNKDRIIPISIHAIHAIEQYKRFERVEPHKSCPTLLFVTGSGKKISRVHIWKMCKRLYELSKINKGATTHTLRHTFATHLKAEGANLTDIQKLLGHESIMDTQRYAQVDPSKLRAAIEKLTSNQLKDEPANQPVYILHRERKTPIEAHRY